MKYNKKLFKWIVILPLLGVLITAIFLVKIFVSYTKESYEKSMFQAHKDIIKQNKLDAKERIENLVYYIQKSQNSIEQEYKNNIKDLINFAINIIDTSYKEYKHLPKQEILEKIKIKLREVRFFDNETGYFFIIDLEGKAILSPPRPFLEDTNVLNIKDASGNYPVKEAIYIANESVDGYGEWYWQKPNEKVMKKKLGYVRVYEPLGIYVGTARYEEDIFKSFKKDMQKLLIDTRYGEDGYIFAFDYNGYIISHVKKSLIGTNKNSAKPKGKKIIESIIEGAKQSKEGFFMSYIATLNPKTGKSARKTSFIKSIPTLKWAIGTGVYSNDVSEQIEKRHQILKKDLTKTISNIAYFATAFLVVILLLEIVIFYKLIKVIQNYQDKLKHNAKHDFLTALPNRRLFRDRLNQAIKYSKRNQIELAVMFIDVDSFKDINDNLGHDIGDEVLQKIALILKESIRESDVVARQGGDEFIVLINDCKSRNDIMLVADKIQKTMHKPVCMNGICHDVTLSIGISMFPHDGEDEKTLLKHADIAMYKAKADGRDRYNFFN